MARKKIVKAKVNDSEHGLYNYIAKMRGKTVADIIHEGFEREKQELEYWLKTEKHWAIFDMISDIILCSDKAFDYPILRLVDKGLKKSIDSLSIGCNTNPLQTEANLPAIVAEFEMLLEQEIEGEKVYNLIGDKLAEWDQVKIDWKL